MPHGHAEFPQHPHGEKARDEGGLVIVHAPADEHVVLRQPGRVKGRINPTVPHGHHVQMGDHADAVRRVAPGDGTGIAVVIRGGKAVKAAPFQGIVQHLAAIRAEGRSGSSQISAADGGNAGDLLQLQDVFLPVGGDPCVRAGEKFGAVHIIQLL